MASEPSHHPLEAVMGEYIALFEGSWKDKTKVHYQAAFRRLTDWLATAGRPTSTESLDFRSLLEFVNHLRGQRVVRGVWRGDSEEAARRRRDSSAPAMSLNSINSTMRSIRSLALWARDENLLDENPFARKYRRGKGHPLLPEEQSAPKSATGDDLRALVKGCAGTAPIDLRDQAIVALMLSTGARNGSVRLLRLEDVDLTRNTISFLHAKGNKSFVVALQPETKATLIRYLNRARKRLLPRYPVRGFERISAGPDPGWLFLASDNGYGKGEPLTTNGLSQMLNRRYHAGAGAIAHFGSHRIRHAIGTILANNGVGLEEIRQYYAHSSTDTTKIYAVHSPEALGRIVGTALRDSGVIGQETRRRRTA
jgi:Site-specific recombinase XerD